MILDRTEGWRHHNKQSKSNRKYNLAWSLGTPTRRRRHLKRDGLLPVARPNETRKENISIVLGVEEQEEEEKVSFRSNGQSSLESYATSWVLEVLRFYFLLHRNQDSESPKGWKSDSGSRAEIITPLLSSFRKWSRTQCAAELSPWPPARKPFTFIVDKTKLYFREKYEQRGLISSLHKYAWCLESHIIVPWFQGFLDLLIALREKVIVIPLLIEPIRENGKESRMRFDFASSSRESGASGPSWLHVLVL